MGLWLSARWKMRLSLLIRLRRMIYFLKGEIIYNHAPLAEALERVGSRSGGCFGTLFTEAAERIERQEGELFGKIWEEETEKLRAQDGGKLLSGEDIDGLKSLGSHLGYLDVDMQERTLLLYLEQLDDTILYLKSHLKEKCRLSVSLGIMGGMFLVIVMC
jgi:stage III sporulation protein AB